MIFATALNLSTPILVLLTLITIIFFGMFIISSAYFAKDSLNEKDPEKKRSTEKVRRKIAADALFQRNRK
tara:strand:- start:88 stop:297 length:210 start_codon:yes stop_codon:yes gene_type:complete